MENQKQEQAKSKSDFSKENMAHPDQGLNNWNARLDENLEPEGHNNSIADEKAKEFSEKYGSGNQSDEGNS